MPSPPPPPTSDLKVYTCSSFAWLGDEAVAIIVAANETEAREQLAITLRQIGAQLGQSDFVDLLEMVPGVQLFNI